MMVADEDVAVLRLPVAGGGALAGDDHRCFGPGASGHRRSCRATSPTPADRSRAGVRSGRLIVLCLPWVFTACGHLRGSHGSRPAGKVMQVCHSTAVSSRSPADPGRRTGGFFAEVRLVGRSQFILHLFGTVVLIHAFLLCVVATWRVVFSWDAGGRIATASCWPYSSVYSITGPLSS